MYLYIFCDFPVKHFLLQAMEFKKNMCLRFISDAMAAFLWNVSISLSALLRSEMGIFFIKFKFDFLNVYFLNHFWNV